DVGADPASVGGKRVVRPPFVLAAGGTGGHVFPAEALAGELLAHGRGVHLLCDGRADAFARRVPEIESHPLRAGRSGRGPARACALPTVRAPSIPAIRCGRRYSLSPTQATGPRNPADPSSC